MQQDMIVILDLGSSRNTLIARDILYGNKKLDERRANGELV